MRFIKVVPAIIITVCLVFVLAEAAGKKERDIEFDIPDTSIVEIGSNRHTQAEMKNVQVRSIVNLDKFEKKLENKTLEIWFHEKSASLRIVDKRNGYIWGFVDTEKPDNLNKSWFAMASSIVTLEYYDQKGAEQRISLSSRGVEAEYNWKENSMECYVRMKKLSIELKFIMILKEDKISLAVEKDSLKEEGKNKIKAIYFLPFLGTTQETEIDGYMFVPDGPGALIRYRTAAHYATGFSKKIYGMDMGIDSLTAPSGLMASRSDDYLVEEPQITMPVYGIVHGPGKNAILSVIDEGKEYATIVANVSGIQTNYNWISARFDYRQSYMHPTTKSGTGVYMPQEERNDLLPAISFYFLTGEEADYSGMAVRYRCQLEDQGILGTEREDTKIPLRLDIIGADIRKGFLFNPLTVFTDTKEADNILRTVREAEITNTTVTYEGWQKGGLNGADYGETSFDHRVGTEKDFKVLKEETEQSGGRFYLSLNPVTANIDQINKASQAVVTLSRAYAKISRSDKNLLYKDYYFIKPSVVMDCLEKITKERKDFDMAFAQLGYLLYGDNTRNHVISRREVMEKVEKYFAATKKAAFYNPNEYLWKYTSEYYDIPMVNSQYLYETDTVPFLQIVLKGSIDYYAPYVNQGSYSVNSILKMIEYGTYPSFIVGAAPNHMLADTQLMDLFSICFPDWKDTIINVYDQLSSVLNQVEGARIQEHKVLKTGLVRITYDNGIKIYINYTMSEQTADRVKIPALGAASGR